MMGELSHREGALAMHKGLLKAATMGDERDNKPSGLMGILLEEISAQAGQRTGPVPITIEASGQTLVLSADGWAHFETEAPEPPSMGLHAIATATLAEWSRTEADGWIDALMDAPLEQRAKLVDNLLARVEDDDAPEGYINNVCAVLGFIDEGLALDGESAELSIRIQTALLDLS